MVCVRFLVQPQRRDSHDECLNEFATYGHMDTQMWTKTSETSNMFVGQDESILNIL
ncbi:hypothetical protein DPMN_032065 [Dreissena polymorpha]|uniref:Uncharacterized protein n=1 Tax=Dreissena polymorpha TaxID=45954 RepID=A0A9D4M154_DREPO|nr:hypothetical protein DPMN_032065 [Dreissena polymorpha]